MDYGFVLRPKNANIYVFREQQHPSLKFRAGKRKNSCE